MQPIKDAHKKRVDGIDPRCRFWVTQAILVFKFKCQNQIPRNTNPNVIVAGSCFVMMTPRLHSRTASSPADSETLPHRLWSYLEDTMRKSFRVLWSACAPRAYYITSYDVILETCRLFSLRATPESHVCGHASVSPPSHVSQSPTTSTHSSYLGDSIRFLYPRKRQDPLRRARPAKQTKTRTCGDP